MKGDGMRWLAAGLLAVMLAGVAVAAPKYGERQVADLVEIAQGESNPEARRAKAIRELENTDVRTHLSVLRRLLREERSLDIRLSTTCTLAALGDRKAPRDLLLATAYVGDHTPNCTRSDVLIALARIGDAAAEMHLQKALQSGAPEDEPYFYADACRAAAILNTPGARKLLFTALRDGKPELRHAAVAPLARIAADAKSPDRANAREALITAARRDPVDKVAEQAASSLFWSGVDGAAFYRLLDSDPDAKVRARAARVMNRQYLTPPRLQHLRATLGKEKDASVREVISARLK